MITIMIVINNNNNNNYDNNNNNNNNNNDIERWNEKLGAETNSSHKSQIKSRMIERKIVHTLIYRIY